VENWKDNKVVFWVTALPGVFWLTVFFLIPLALMWGMSFGEKTSLIDVEVTGTLDNYIRAFDPLYLKIIWKSIWISVISNACLPCHCLSDRLRHLLLASKDGGLCCCCWSSCRSGSTC
jgi:ABC-type spermidine/putrescine transport system permease subunit I